MNEDLPAPGADVDSRVAGVPAGRVPTHDYAIGGEHSNSYEVCKKLGSPQSPGQPQYCRLERAGQLELAGSPEWCDTQDGGLYAELIRNGSFAEGPTLDGW